MNWLLNLYPPAWQRRYRGEIQAHLEETNAPSLRTALDLVAGAVDAWLNPKLISETTKAGGEQTMKITACRCGPEDISKADAVKSATWMIGTTLVLTLVSLALDRVYGPHILVEALIYSSFFIAFTISSRNTYLKPYSRNARNVMMVAAVLGWYVFFLAVSAFKTAT